MANAFINKELVSKSSFQEPRLGEKNLELFFFYIVCCLLVQVGGYKQQAPSARPHSQHRVGIYLQNGLTLCPALSLPQCRGARW